MKREFLQNFKVGDQPLPNEIVDAIKNAFKAIPNELVRKNTNDLVGSARITA